MTYVPYDTKEENTTVGMPELATVEKPVEGECTNTDDDENVERLSEDVYAFIAASPVFSFAFFYALFVVGVKYFVYITLWLGIYGDMDQLYRSPAKVQAVKFLLIPVAVSMQEDLIHVYASAANLKYDKKVLEKHPYATKGKLILGMLLRAIDGLFSLSVNFFVMLQTHDSVRQVFLNFAALHFLQSIDDVFFTLNKNGFFGDAMELQSTKCTEVKYPRRVSSGIVKEFDSFLFNLTIFVMVVIYFVYTAVSPPTGDEA